MHFPLTIQRLIKPYVPINYTFADYGQYNDGSTLRIDWRFLSLQFLNSPILLTQVALFISILSCVSPQPTILIDEAHQQPIPSTTTPTEMPRPTIPPPHSIPTVTPIAEQNHRIPTGLSGGSLTIANSAHTPDFDVHQTHQKTLSTLGPGLAYSRLLRIKTGPRVMQPSLILECDLCQSWKINSDFSYEFLLPSTTRWQNISPVNGRNLVASDLIYSYNRLETESWPYSTLFKDRGVSEFLTNGPTSLKIERGFLDTDVLLALADGHSKIVAPEVVRDYGDLKQGPVIGTGPWIWESTEPGVGTKLSRNPDYFEPGFPYLDNLFIKTIKPEYDPYPNRKRQVAAFKTGLVDVVALSSKEWDSLQSSATQFNSYKSESNHAEILFWFNTGTQLGSNREIRQAVFYSIDPWESLHSIWKDLGSVNMGIPVSSPDWLLPRKTMRQKYFANPAEARTKLENHKDKGSFDIQIALADSGQEMLVYGQSIQEDLKAIGFNPTIRLIHTTHQAELLGKENNPFDIMIGRVPTAASTNGFLLGLIHNEGPVNLLRHHDKKINRLIEIQITEDDQDKRKRQLLALQEYLLEEAYFYSPISSGTGWAFIWELQDFYPNTALSEYIFWSKTWLNP